MASQTFAMGMLPLSTAQHCLMSHDHDAPVSQHRKNICSMSSSDRSGSSCNRRPRSVRGHRQHSIRLLVICSALAREPQPTRRQNLR